MPSLSYSDLGISAGFGSFGRKGLQYISEHYSYVFTQSKFIIAHVEPDVTGILLGYSYDRGYSSTDGLPQYSKFYFISPSGSSTNERVKFFGTGGYSYQGGVF